jgi:TRAP-type C4-dicarboxylate transport system permease small subunit
LLPLLALVALPLTEIVLRRFHTGISGATAFVQHFTLMVGMLGGAIAAREGRLLSFSSLASFFKGKLKTMALILSSGTAAAISALLCVASIQFVLSERSSGGRLAYGIPLWIIELALPLGFGLIALRLVWHSAPAWKERLLALCLAGAIVGFGTWSTIATEKVFV